METIAKGRIFFVMPNVIMLNVIMLNIVMLNATILIVIMLNDIMLSVIVLYNTAPITNRKLGILILSITTIGKIVKRYHCVILSFIF